METNLISNLVIGFGEIGKAVQAVLGCDHHDLNESTAKGEYDIIHVCIPYNSEFEKNVVLYQQLFNPKHTVIHSTVPVGVSSKLNAVHSPVRGVHPTLEQSVRTFVKYFGGKDAEIVAKEFEKKGVTCIYLSEAKTTELMKLVDTTSYGVNILIQKEIKRLCDEHGVSFDDVYTSSNLTYNEGYEKMTMPQFKKYVLKDYPGKIGGHCILPNIELFDSWMCDLIREKNATL